MASTEFTLDQSLYAFSSGSAASGCHRCCFFFHVVVHQRTTTAPAKITLTVAIAAIWSTRIVRLGSERRELGHRDVDVDCVVVLHTGSTKTESSLIRLVQMHTTFLGRHRWPKELVSGLRRSRQRIEVPTDSRDGYDIQDLHSPGMWPKSNEAKLSGTGVYTTPQCMKNNACQKRKE
jgi:hypothetical protein